MSEENEAPPRLQAEVLPPGGLEEEADDSDSPELAPMLDMAQPVSSEYDDDSELPPTLSPNPIHAEPLPSTSTEELKKERPGRRGKKMPKGRGDLGDEAEDSDENRHEVRDEEKTKAQLTAMDRPPKAPVMLAHDDHEQVAMHHAYPSTSTVAQLSRAASSCSTLTPLQTPMQQMTPYPP